MLDQRYLKENFSRVPMRLKSIAKTTTSYALYGSGALHIHQRFSQIRKQPIILGFHRVVNNFEESAQDYIPSMLTSAKTLERYLDWIGKRRRFVSLQEAVDSYKENGHSREPLAAVTFDDGYQDVYDNAFPLLKRKGIPFTVFVVSDLVGTDLLLPHDELFLLMKKAVEKWSPQANTRLHKLINKRGLGEKIHINEADVFASMRTCLVTLQQRDLARLIFSLRDSVGQAENTETHRMLSWQMVQEMHRNGVTIGSHSASHPILSNESRAKVTAEMKDSKRKIESMIGNEARHFAYPDGKFDPEVAATAGDTGYTSACTTGDHDPAFPDLTVPRDR